MKIFCKKAKQGNGHQVMPFILYDCSIEDINERTAAAIHLNSAKEVASHIGIPRTQVPKYASKEAIIERKRYFSKKHKREYAIRIDTEKINSCTK